jgi:hypothetical protein
VAIDGDVGFPSEAKWGSHTTGNMLNVTELSTVKRFTSAGAAGR